MKVIARDITNDFHRDTYWTKLSVSSDDDTETTAVYICASFEYISHKFGKIKIAEEDVNKWLSEVIDVWSKKDRDIFSEPTHFETYATTTEGKENGYLYLKNEVANKLA
jgi:hypothetical protein